MEKSVPKQSWSGWQLLMAAAFTAGTLVLALRDVNFSKVISILSQADLGLLALAVITVVANIAAKAVRWRLLFALHKQPSLGRCFSVLSIGLLANMIAPTRLGEFVRAFLIGETESASKVYALGTIAVEKIIELTVILISVALLLTQMALPDWLMEPARIAFTITLFIVLLLFVAWQQDAILRGVGWTSRFIPWVSKERLIEQAQYALVSLSVLRYPRLLSGLFAWSIIAWLFGISTNYLVLLAMGLSLPIWTALLLLVVLQVGVAAIPSAPGQVGVFHYLVILSLSLFTVPKEVALGYGIVLHLIIYMPLTLMGIFALWREKIAWQRLLNFHIR